MLKFQRLMKGVIFFLHPRSWSPQVYPWTSATIQLRHPGSGYFTFANPKRLQRRFSKNNRKNKGFLNNSHPWSSPVKLVVLNSFVMQDTVHSVGILTIPCPPSWWGKWDSERLRKLLLFDSRRWIRAVPEATELHHLSHQSLTSHFRAARTPKPNFATFSL